MKKQDWFPNIVPKSLVYKVDQRESTSVASTIPLIAPINYTTYGITINPNPNKRIALKISGQKSVCKKYSNYSNDEQDRILLDLLSPIKHLVTDDICYEKTSLENRHIHTTIKIPQDSHYGLEMEALSRYEQGIHKRCTDKKDNYEALDVKELRTDADQVAWKKYIHKEFKK